MYILCSIFFMADMLYFLISRILNLESLSYFIIIAKIMSRIHVFFYTFPSTFTSVISFVRAEGSLIVNALPPQMINTVFLPFQRPVSWIPKVSTILNKRPKNPYKLWWRHSVGTLLLKCLKETIKKLVVIIVCWDISSKFKFLNKNILLGLIYLFYMISVINIVFQNHKKY